MRDYSPILVPLGYQDITSAPGHLPRSYTSHPSFNDMYNAAFTPAPTTSMGKLTEIAQSSYMHSVSKQRIDH
jgi:hypothetical protein